MKRISWKIKENRDKLMGAKSDRELQEAFPDLSVDILRRYQRKFRPAKKEVGKIWKVIILPDIHYPLHDSLCWKVVLKFLEWFKPDEIVLLGDALEMECIDHWKHEKQNVRYFETKRLIKEYRGFISEILEPIEKLCPKAKKVYMGGNHEDWAYQMVDREPQLEGMIEPEITLELEKRGWQWIPYLVKQSGRLVPGFYKIGKLTLTHGQYTNIYHAAKMANNWDRSVCYGHTHDLQLYTKVHTEDPSDFHTAQSVGALCNLSPSYLWGRPNRWVHAFGVLYVRQDGLYNLYVPVIIDGKFVFCGQLFDGN
jgi:predicted phosphodiesterase